MSITIRQIANRFVRKVELQTRPTPCSRCCVGEYSLHGATLRSMEVRHCDCTKTCAYDDGGN